MIYSGNASVNSDVCKDLSIFGTSANIFRDVKPG